MIGLFRKRKEASKQDVEEEQAYKKEWAAKPDYKLIQGWNDELAGYDFTLYEKSCTLYGTYFYDPVASGDIVWADRIAEHYGISITWKSKDEGKNDEV